MTALLWLVRHPVGASLLFMLLVSAGSSALAKHEMAVNRSLRVQIDMANASLERQQKNQQIVTEVSKSYENRLSNLNSRLAAIRLRPSRCIVPIPTAAARPDGSAATAPGPGSVGITSESLLNFEGDCHREVFKLMSLQDFINRVSK